MALSSLLLVAALLFGSVRVVAQSSETLEPVIASMEGWLQARRLAPAFELQTLRRGSRPDDSAARSLKLELRFLTGGTDQAEEDRRFVSALQQFDRANNTSVAEALFFKLVHLAQIAPEDAYVTVDVLEKTYEIVADPSSGRPHFHLKRDRDVRVEVSLPGTSARQPHTTIPGVVQAGALPDLVQRFLTDFFTRRNAAARLPAPRFSLKPLTSRYVGMDVEGIRRIVIPKEDFWESLQISVQMYDTPEGRLATCYLDGGFSTGFGSRLPAREGYTDLAVKYQADLERFANELMRGLQVYLATTGR